MTVFRKTGVFRAVAAAIANTAPVISADLAFVTGEDIAITLTQAQLIANATDANGDALTASNVQAVANSTVLDNGDGTFTVTPSLNYNGVVALTYDVTDGQVTVSGNISLTVSPVNDAPIAADQAFSLPQDSVLIISDIQLLTGAVDVDGDALTVTGVSHSGVNGSLVDNLNGTYTYTPNASYVGSDSFTFLVSDGSTVSLGTSSLTITSTASATILGVNSTIGNDALTKQNVIDGVGVWQTLGRALWGTADRALAQANPATYAAEAVAAGEIVEIQDDAIYEYDGTGAVGVTSAYTQPIFATNNSGVLGNVITVRGAASQLPLKPTLRATINTGDSAIIGNDTVFQNNYVDYYNLKVVDNVVSADQLDSEITMIRFSGGVGITAHEIELIGQTRDWLSHAGGTLGKNYTAARFENANNCHLYNSKIHGFKDTADRGTSTDTYGAVDCSVHNCTIYDMNNGMQMKANAGASSTRESNVQYYQNLVFNCNKQTLWVSGIGGTNLPNLVYQNIFIGGTNCIKIESSDALYVKNIIFANNTCIDPVGDNLNQFNWAYADNQVYANNINIVAGNYRHMNCAGSFALPRGIEFSDNLYYRVDTAGINPRYYGPGAVEHRSLAAWNNAFEANACATALLDNDCTSTEGSDPLFAAYQDSATFNLANDPTAVVNYKLQAGSPAINNGVNVIAELGTIGASITQGAYISGTEQIGADW